jgi:hypothetical protein
MDTIGVDDGALHLLGPAIALVCPTFTLAAINTAIRHEIIFIFLSKRPAA